MAMLDAILAVRETKLRLSDSQKEKLIAVIDDEIMSNESIKKALYTRVDETLSRYER